MLHFIQYSQMQGWSVLRHVQRSFGYTDRYPLVAIGEFLRQVRNEITVQDDVEYKQLTVKTKGGGVCLRTTRMGRDIGTKQQWRASAGQFITSKIDARNGAMGIIPEELDGAIVTHDFPLFSIDEDRINPQFLLLITTTNAFQQFSQSCSSGTTNRQRINISKFLQQQIPLPSIEEQNKMVEEYDKITHEAERNEELNANVPKHINDYLKVELGLELQTGATHKGMKFTHFRDLTRWDYLYYNADKQFKSHYDLVSLGTLVNNFLCDDRGQSLRRCTADKPQELFTYIGMEYVEKDTGRLLEEHIVEGREIKSQSLEVPKGFILYGKLRPYLNKYWVNNTGLDNVVCSSEFFVFNVCSGISKDYFVYMLASDFVQQQISDATSGARMPRINEKTFKEIQIPLPPLTVQQEIISHVKAEREKAKTLREEAEALRQKAIEDFESNIFEQQAKESNEQ